MRQLATPAGIDHDYNFLSAIERGVERSDRRIVEDKQLLDKRDLLQGPQDPRGQSQRGRGRGRGGRSMGDGSSHPRSLGENDQKIRRDIQRIGVRVERLPKGMERQKLNGTSWSKKQKCIVWQVEWVADAANNGHPSGLRSADSPSQKSLDNHEVAGPEGRREANESMGIPKRTRSKILTTTPIRAAYLALIEEDRRAAMTPEEKSKEKKRKAQIVADTEAKKAKHSTSIQQPTEGQHSDQDQSEEKHGIISEQGSHAVHLVAEDGINATDFAFYLYRPHTPSNLPSVLIPLRPDLSLEIQLQGKVIIEYPTIFVFPVGQPFPDGFILEDEFFRMQGIGKTLPLMSKEDEEVDSDDDSESDIDAGNEIGPIADKAEVPESDTSSSGTSDDDDDEEEELSDHDDGEEVKEGEAGEAGEKVEHKDSGVVKGEGLWSEGPSVPGGHTPNEDTPMAL